MIPQLNIANESSLRIATGNIRTKQCAQGKLREMKKINGQQRRRPRQLKQIKKTHQHDTKINKQIQESDPNSSRINEINQGTGNAHLTRTEKNQTTTKLQSWET